MRLDKYIAKMSVKSRKEVKSIIKEGLVSVNEEIITNPGYRIAKYDQVKINNKEIIYKEHEYVMLNKPSGYVTAASDKKHKTIYDLIDEYLIKRQLSSIGRLDIDTEGLIILTDDGELIHKIISPNNKVSKMYFVKTNKKLNEQIVERFKEGVYIGKGEKTRSAFLEINKNNKYECFVKINEGKFHQIKRMFYEVEYNVEYLKRVSIGDIRLDDKLKLGEYRFLDDNEIKILKKNIE